MLPKLMCRTTVCVVFAMPEVAIAKNCKPILLYAYVRGSVHAFDVLTVPKSFMPQGMTKYNFDGSIFAFDGCHNIVSC